MGQELGPRSQTPALDEALADVLRRADEGRPVTLDWLRRTYPRHWEELHQSLVLLTWLDEDPQGTQRSVEELAGTTVGGLRLERLVGVGASGATYRATDADGERAVCVKILAPELATRRDGVRRFLREARLGASVRHPNVVQVHAADACEVGGRRTAYLVMEFVEGRTLRQILAEDGPLDDAACRAVGRDVAAGLAAVHRAGAVHRDLKPSNVLVASDGTVKVADLGVAWADDVVSDPTAESGFAGTLRYAAPEQFGEGPSGTDRRADLYGLGMILYEIATGEPVRGADSVGQVVVQAVAAKAPSARRRSASVSRFLDAVIDTLLAPDPDDRFADAETVREVLDAGEDGDWWRERRDGPSSSLPQLLACARNTPFLGRAQALATLLGALDDADRGAGATWLVEGPGGMGKTRLVAEVGARAGARDAVVLAVGPGGDEDPWETLWHAVCEGLGSASSDFPEDPESAILAALRDAAGNRTILLVVEDLHDATPQARQVFSSLSRGLSGSRVLLIGSLRPMGNDPWLLHATVIDGARVLSLGRLDADAARSLVEGVLGENAFEDAELAQIVETAGGLPLSLLLEADRRAGRVVGETSVTRIATGRARSVPRAILDAVHASLASLAPADRRLLEAAACCGRRFTAGQAAVAASREPAAVTDDLDRIVAAVDLIESRGDGYLFLHDLIRDAAEALAHVDTTAAAHLALAEQLVLAAGGEESLAGVELATFTRHLLLAGEWERAEPHLFFAVAYLQSRSHQAQAARLCETALGFPEFASGVVGARLNRLVADSALWQGDVEVARGRSAVARHLAEATEDVFIRVFCLGNAVDLCDQTSAPLEARRLALEMLKLTDELDNDNARLHTLRWAGLTALRLGDVDDARRHFERYDRVAETSGIPWSRIGSFDNWQQLAALQCRLEDLLLFMERSEREAAAQDQPRMVAASRADRAATLVTSGRLGEALPMLRESLDHARRTCQARLAASLLGAMGKLYGWCGDYEECVRANAVATTVHERTERVAYSATRIAELAHAESRLGSVQAAFGRFRGALHMVRSTRIPGLLGGVLRLGVGITHRAGRTHTSGRLARHLETVAASFGCEPVRAAARVWARLATGRSGEAAQILRESSDVLLSLSRLELSHAVWRMSGRAEDLAVAERCVREFLDNCPDELRQSAETRSPEIRDVLAAI